MSICICVYKPRLDVEFNGEEWTDRQSHELISITFFNSVYKKNKSWKKYRKKLTFIGYKTYNTNNYIPVDRVYYNQGWWLKNSFFNKKCTTIFCLNKKEIENFFKRYAKSSANPIKQEVLDYWEDGMIFECSW